MFANKYHVLNYCLPFQCICIKCLLMSKDFANVIFGTDQCPARCGDIQLQLHRNRRFMTATAPQLQQLLTLKLHPHRNCKIATATAPQLQKIWNSHLAPHYNCSCVILSANNTHFPFNISIFTNFHTPYQKSH